MAKARAYSPSQVINYKYKELDFTADPKFFESFGSPEQNAIVLIFGPSGSGKTRLVLQLTKFLAEKFGVVAYNSLEEGKKKSFANALEENHMRDLDGKFKLIDREAIEDFVLRLQKRKSAQFVVLDSVQYTGINYDAYKDIKRKLKKKMLIFISHANGNNPAGSTADKIRYDADIKVHVLNYVAMVVSRYGGNKPFVIWEEGARKKWGKKYQQVIQGKYWPGQKK
jgi:KaiC/GvpD/RAD55 family RecA-like ATPase